jgi:hypothetical protein
MHRNQHCPLLFSALVKGFDTEARLECVKYWGLSADDCYWSFMMEKSNVRSTVHILSDNMNDHSIIPFLNTKKTGN